MILEEDAERALERLLFELRLIERDERRLTVALIVPSEPSRIAPSPLPPPLELPPAGVACVTRSITFGVPLV